MSDKQAPINDKFEEMMISAVRYALGRMTYIVQDTTDYITAFAPDLSTRTLQIILRDIDDERARATRMHSPNVLGMECDRKAWERLEDKLLHELEHRE